MTRGDCWLYGRWPERLDDSHALREIRVIAQLDGENLRINRRGVYPPIGDHPQGVRVKTGRYHTTEEAARLAELCQRVAGDVVARMQIPIVLGPDAAAQVGERAIRAGAPNDYIGEVDGQPTIPLALEHRRREKLDGRIAASGQLDIWQPADEAHLDLALPERIERATNAQFRLAIKLPANVVGDGLVDRVHVGSQECRETDQLSIHERAFCAEPAPATLDSPGRSWYDCRANRVSALIRPKRCSVVAWMTPCRAPGSS